MAESLAATQEGGAADWAADRGSDDRKVILTLRLRGPSAVVVIERLNAAMALQRRLPFPTVERLCLHKTTAVTFRKHMEKTETETLEQVNVRLTVEEYAELQRICETECINRPSMLVGIWIRSNIKARAGMTQLLDLVREAQQEGVDVAAVLTRARAKAAK